MTIQDQDRATLKDIMRELIQEEPMLFRPIFSEIVKEHIQSNSGNLPTKDQTRTEKLMKEIFDQYDDVFKALA